MAEGAEEVQGNNLEIDDKSPKRPEGSSLHEVPPEVQERFKTAIERVQSSLGSVDAIERDLRAQNLFLASRNKDTRFGRNFHRKYFTEINGYFVPLTAFDYYPDDKKGNPNISISQGQESTLLGEFDRIDMVGTSASERIDFIRVANIGKKGPAEMNLWFNDENNPSANTIALSYKENGERKRAEFEFRKNSGNFIKINFTQSDIAIYDPTTQRELDEGLVTIDNKDTMIKITIIKRGDDGKPVIEDDKPVATDVFSFPTDVTMAETLATFVTPQLLEDPYGASIEADDSWRKKPIGKTLGITWERKEKTRQEREKYRKMIKEHLQVDIPDDESINE